MLLALVLVVAGGLDQARGQRVAVQRVDNQERARAAVVQVVLQRQRGGEPELGVAMSFSSGWKRPPA